MFSFEAGRRCDSGPGNFTFDTKQGNEIFTLVDQAIQSQKAQAEERHLSIPSNFDPECPASLQHIRNPGCITSGSGDSSSCSSREADGDSGGSKPGSADGVLGKREGGDGGRGQGVGAAGALKGRSLPEPPTMLGVLGGGGTPPRSPRGQPAGKGISLPDEQTGLYSEPADAVRLPLPSADCLYSDPVDSIKSQNQISTASTLPVPTPRLRPVGDESLGSGNQEDHPHGSTNHRKHPDLYSHVYDRIDLELNVKTNALSLNGVAGGRRGGGRGVNSNRRVPAAQAEGSLSPSALRHEHIYDEPEGCAMPSGSGMSIYDEARLEPLSLKRQDEVGSGPEGNYNTPSTGKTLESQRHSPPQLGPSRGMSQAPVPKLPKPVTAPKPGRAGKPNRKEPVPLPPGKHGGLGSNVNNNNNNIWGGGGGGKELYSKVSKQKPLPVNWYSQHHPDIIYDNLGDI